MPDASRISTAHRQRFVLLHYVQGNCGAKHVYSRKCRGTKEATAENLQLCRQEPCRGGGRLPNGRQVAERAAVLIPADPVMSIDVLFRYAKPEHLRLKGGALHAQFRCGAVGSGNHPADLPQNLQDVVPLHSSRVPGIERFPSALRLHNSPTGPAGLCPPSELLSVPE